MAKVIMCKDSTYVVEDGRGEITKQMKAYNKKQELEKDFYE